MTPKEIADRLQLNLLNLTEQKDRTFAVSLINGLLLKGSLSDKQLFWLKKLDERALGVEAPKPAPAQVENAKDIVSLFDRALVNLKRPKIVMHAAGLDIRLSVAGSMSKMPGSINMTSTDGDYEGRTWYGRVTREGAFMPSQKLDATQADQVLIAVREFAKDPAGQAAAYGKRTGHCCFCNRKLTDARSTEVGYGATCADNYGLPWGEVTTLDQPLTCAAA